MTTTIIPLASVLTLGGDSIFGGVLLTVLFSAVGILMMLLGFKLVDAITPGNLSQEIIEKRNVAAAIVSGAMIIGIGMIIAAALIG